MSADNWARDNEEELSAFNTAHLALDDEQEIDVSLPPPGCVCVLSLSFEFVFVFEFVCF